MTDQEGAAAPLTLALHSEGGATPERGAELLCHAGGSCRRVSEFTFRAVQPGCPSGLRVDPPLMAETPNLKI